MTTPRSNEQGSLVEWIGAVIGRTIRTTPGLVLITLGSAITVFDHPWIGLGIAGIGALIYRENCYRTPYTPCWRCEGLGYREHTRRWIHSSHLRACRACRACRGRGVRIRWGRAAMNAYRRATYTPPTPEQAAAARAPRRPGPVDVPEAIRRRLGGH